MQEKRKKGAVGVEVQKSLGWGPPKSLADSWAVLAQASQTVAAMGLKVGQGHQKLSLTEGYWRSSPASGETSSPPFFYSEDQAKIPEIPYLLYMH